MGAKTSGPADIICRCLLGILFAANCSPAFGVELATKAPASTPDLVSQSNMLQRTPGAAGKDGLLPADRAFKMSVLIVDAKTVAIDFTPAIDYYLYRDKFAFRVQEPLEVRVTSIDLPPGEIKDDPFFGKTEIFHSKVRAFIRLQRTSAAPIVLDVAYQGCNDRIGVCYPPIEKRLRLELPSPANLR